MANLPPVPAGLDRRLTRWLEQAARILGMTQSVSAVTGDFKLAFTEQAGWLVADGREISKDDYPGLYRLFGGRYGQTADTFNLPDLTDGVFYGSSTAGEVIGSDYQTLGINNLPAHTHGIEETPHTHEIDDHSHAIPALSGDAAGSVTVTITDPGHAHAGVAKAGTTYGLSGTGALDLGASTDTATTGITATGSFTGATVTTDADDTGDASLTMTEATGATITQSTGGGANFSVRQRGVGLLPLIKT